MPTTRKGTNFKEFASTMRNPPLQFDNPSTPGPFSTPRGELLKGLGAEFQNEFLKSVGEWDINLATGKIIVNGKDESKSVFKNLAQKIKEDGDLKNPLGKMAKAAIVNKANLSGGDLLAETLNIIVDSFAGNETSDSIGIFKKDTSALLRQALLKSVGIHTLKFLAMLGVSGLARAIPIELITQFNVEQYIKKLDPFVMLDIMIASLKNKTLANDLTQYRSVAQTVYFILNSSTFESLRVKQSFLEFLKSNPEATEKVKNANSFSEITGFLEPIASPVDWEATDKLIAEAEEEAKLEKSDASDSIADEKTLITIFSSLRDYINSSDAGPDQTLLYNELASKPITPETVFSFSDDLSGLVSGAQDDLQGIFDSFENCELPSPDVFAKYRPVTPMEKIQYPEEPEPIINEIKKSKQSSVRKMAESAGFKLPDKREIVQSLISSAMTAAFYVATKLAFKIVIAYLQQLVPDLSCASISAMLPVEGLLGPKNQNRRPSVDTVAARIAESIAKNNPNISNFVKLEDIKGLLTEIATSVGVFKGADINVLNEFMSLATTVLTDREYCELIRGVPSQDTITIIQNIIDTRYPNGGISRVPEDIIRLFTSIGSLTGSNCEEALNTIEMPVNSLYCSTPEYYRLYTELRTSLLKEKGLTDDEVAEQVKKACEINAQQIRQLLDFVNSDNPISEMMPAIGIGEETCNPSAIEEVNEIVSKRLTKSYDKVYSPLKQVLDINMIGTGGFLSSVLSCKHNVGFPEFLNIIENANNTSTYNTFVSSIDESEQQTNTQIPTDLYSSIEPKHVASWLRLNQEEFCNLGYDRRLRVTPLSEQPDSFNNLQVSYELSHEDRIRMIILSRFTKEQLETLPDEMKIGYEDLFNRLGNINFAVRALSFCGIYDLSQSSIKNLSFDGIRQVNLEAGALTENVHPNPKYMAIMALALLFPVPSVFSTINMTSNSFAKVTVAKNKDGVDKKSPALPGVDKYISSTETAYRVKSHNFFILPTSPDDMNAGTIRTKIIDFYPSSIIEKILSDPYKSDPLNNNASYEQAEYINVTSANQLQFNSSHSELEIMEITKQSNDYLFDVTENSVSTPTLTSLLEDSNFVGSKQSLLFAEIVLNAIKNNVGIQLQNIPRLEEFVEYLRKDLFNYTFNSFMDGMLKIPAINGKNLNYGITDQRVNTLDGFHVNTITGELDPVDPAIYGGTEINPSYYFYNKLSDDWKNLFNLYVRERSDEHTPARTPLPDFQNLAEQSSKLYMKLQEEYREANDYSNQVPFDLIVSKASLTSMDGLIEMMIRTFSFENYYKGFSFLNTVEITDNVFDNVYFDFLAKRFVEVAIEAGPKSSATDKTANRKKFYHMLMEIYVMLLDKKKEARISSMTQTEEDLVIQIFRKANIWKIGFPKDNLTDVEKSYLNSYAEIARYEVPGYPAGTITSAIGAAEGAVGPMNKIFAEAKKQRKRQIELRNELWTRLMEDCEPLFEQLLRLRFKKEMNSISEQLAILNPNLIKENNIITMPINGGPIVQSGEDITIDTTFTAHMRNVYSYQPAMLYSAGNILISDLAYRAFYGSKEDNNERNFNGFMFNRLYSKQNFYGVNAAYIKAEPKEPVYDYETVGRTGISENESDVLRGVEQPFLTRETRNSVGSFGDVRMDELKFNPDYLSSNLLNYLELNKRDITTNYFLLNNKHTKAGFDDQWDEMFVFQDEFFDLKDLEMKLTESKGYGVSDYYSSLQEISNTLLSKVEKPPVAYTGVRTFYESINDLSSVENAKYTEYLNPPPIKGKENIDNSIKRYKVFKTEGSVIRKFGIDGYLVGGQDAHNMPIVISQVPAPIVLEQYINLVELGTVSGPNRYFNPSVVGVESYNQVLEKLKTILYDLNNTFSDSRFGHSSRPVYDKIFRGPVSLTNLIYWLGSSGFLYDNESEPEYLDWPIKWFFEPGTLKYGVRLLLLQPDSNLTFLQGSHSYLEEEMLDSVLNTDSDTSQTISASAKAREQKVFTKKVGYSIPLFKAEEEVQWTFRDLKNIYDLYINSSTQQNSATAPSKWIDHTSLTRPVNVRLFNQIICSEDYKKMFDFCIPLRYFASLGAIYTTKGFTESIGSSVDWGGRKRIKNKVFNFKENQVLLPFYQEVRKNFYQSYNSFDPFYEEEKDVSSNLLSEAERQKKLSRPPTSTSANSIVRVSEIQGDILAINRVDPSFKSGLGDLEAVIRDSYTKNYVPDPTNACGSTKDKNVC